MSLPPLPVPVTRQFIGSCVHGKWTYLYTEEVLKAYGQQCREQALLDAMNATLPFGNTGAVIAAAIGALK